MLRPLTRRFGAFVRSGGDTLRGFRGAARRHVAACPAAPRRRSCRRTMTRSCARRVVTRGWTNCRSGEPRSSAFFSTESESGDGASAESAAYVGRSRVRNVAIIAHVDHGKTTLTDKLLQLGGHVIGKDARVMDSIELESERGITIMSKNTRISYKDHIINIVDTPGHQDFGGEVERVLSMVDGAIVLVDATEGVMSQTKFVVQRALEAGLALVVVLNKVDRPTARLSESEVENEIFDLLVTLDADESQLEYTTLYASAKSGWGVADPDLVAELVDLGDVAVERQDLSPLLKAVIDDIPPPCQDNAVEKPFSFVVNGISHDNYLGRLVTGKVETGTVAVGTKVHTLQRRDDDEGDLPAPAASGPAGVDNITRIFCTQGTEKSELSRGDAGDIITLAGVGVATVGDTICDPAILEPLPSPALTPPTLGMTFGANTGPLKGKESASLYVNAAQIKERLQREILNNVTLSLHEANNKDSIEVRGKGELQLGILIENMRREGYEFNVSPPSVLMRENQVTGIAEEPVEEVLVDVNADYQGVVMEKINSIGGVMTDFKEMMEGERARITFTSPTRHLIGFSSELKLDTHADAVVCSTVCGYIAAEEAQAAVAAMTTTKKGRIISTHAGVATQYALHGLEPRGTLFIGPGEEVYEGLVFGEASRNQDIDGNPTKTKKLTNMRASGTDEAYRLSPPRAFSVEELLVYMQEDEIIEVTPTKVRLRKATLSQSERLVLARQRKRGKGAN